MTDFPKKPQQSHYKTVLSQGVTAAATTIPVDTTPSYSSGTATRFTIISSAGVEEFETDTWSTTGAAGNFTSVTRGLAAYNGGSSTAKAHPAGAIVILSNPWQVYDDIDTALQSKVDLAGDTMTGTLAFSGSGIINVPVFADATARDAAIAAPSNGMECYNTALGVMQDYVGGAWVNREAGGTFANASTTVAGKVEMATDAEVDAGTDTGGTGAQLVMTPSQINPNNLGNAKGSLASGDLFIISDSADGNAIKKVTKANMGFLDASTLTAKGSSFFASAASTPAELAAGDDGDTIEYDSSATSGARTSKPLYVGVGSNLQSGVENYQLQWFDVGAGLWLQSGMNGGNTAYQYTTAFLDTTTTGTIITTNPLFMDGTISSGSFDPLRWGDSAYTTVIAEFQFGVAADTAFGANGFGFGLVSNTSSLSDYDDTTNEGVNFAVDSSGNLYARTSNGSSGTETAIAGVTLANRNTYRVEYESGVEARFYVNGTLEATLNTTLPAGTSGGDEIKFGIGITDNGGTVGACASAINVGLIR